MDNVFINWLNKELKKRGWTLSHLARLAGTTPSNISMVLSDKLDPTWEFCVKIAHALNTPPEAVFRHAGLLPPVPDPDGVRNLTEFANHLSKEDIQEVTAYARFRYERGKGVR